MKQSRYYIHDKSKSQDARIARFGIFNERFCVIDRETGSAVAESETAYGARQWMRMLKADAPR